MNIYYELSQPNNSQIYKIDIEGILTNKGMGTVYEISILSNENPDEDESSFIRHVQGEIADYLDQRRKNGKENLVSSLELSELMEDRFNKYNPIQFNYDSLYFDSCKNYI